jgi:hypothetical protein
LSIWWLLVEAVVRIIWVVAVVLADCEQDLVLL